MKLHLPIQTAATPSWAGIIIIIYIIKFVMVRLTASVESRRNGSVGVRLFECFYYFFCSLSKLFINLLTLFSIHVNLTEVNMPNYLLLEKNTAEKLPDCKRIGEAKRPTLKNITASVWEEGRECLQRKPEMGQRCSDADMKCFLKCGIAGA